MWSFHAEGAVFACAHCVSDGGADSQNEIAHDRCFGDIRGRLLFLDGDASIGFIR